jgi:cytochrome c-type biogenesis protein CcmH
MTRAVFHLAALLLFFAIPTALAVSDPREMLPNRPEELRAEEVGHQLRCLVCQNESVEDSDADLARDLRSIVRIRIKAGDSDQQVIDWMVARYGDFVRLRPPFTPVTLLLWLTPVLALSIGAGAVLLSRRRRPAQFAPLTSEDRGRLSRLFEP